jgi:hypothetical protein
MAFAAAAIPYVLAAATAVQVVSSIQQGRQAKATSDFNSQMSLQNARWEQEQSALEAQQVQRENYLRLGAIRAAAGHAGGVATEGSVLDVLADVGQQGELERINTLEQGARKAYGFQAEGAVARATGRAAVSASYLKAGGSLLEGGAKTYDAFQRAPKKKFTYSGSDNRGPGE